MLTSNRSGQFLGAYELRERIGAGGMGTVYRAFHAAMKREVAIKVLPEELAQNPEYLARFNREAETSTKLEHPHIVPVYDYGTIDGISFVVMRLLPGGSLAQRLAQKGIPTLAEANQVLQQLASALDYAHREGVVHRDIKAGNVLFDRQGNAYLADFGIAKLLNATSGFTATGISMGTPSYMAPEQWKGQDPSIQTDIYALGILLYTMLTGKLPFEAPTPFALMDKHLNALPSAPHTVVQSLPEALAPVIEKAIAKQPADRFSSAAAFADAFAGAMAGAPPTEPSGFLTAPIEIHSAPRLSTTPREHKVTTQAAGRWPRRNVIGGIFTLVTLLLLLGAGALVLNSGDEPIPQGRQGANSNALETTPVPVSPPATQPIVALVSTPTPDYTASAAITATASVPPTATDTTADAARSDGATAAAFALEETQTASAWTAAATLDIEGTFAAVGTSEAVRAATAVIRMLTQTAASWTMSPTATLVPTLTPTLTHTPSLTATPTPSRTLTSTFTATVTSTASSTASPARTRTPTATVTQTPSFTPTTRPSETPNPTSTATKTSTATPSPTRTPTKEPTATTSLTSTPALPTATFTPSPTLTPTASPTPLVLQNEILGGLHLDMAFGSKTTGDIAFDGSGRYLALAQQSQEIPLFDRSQGFKPLLPLYLEQGNVNRIAISPDARRLAVTTTFADGVFVFEDFATSLNPQVTHYLTDGLNIRGDVTFSSNSKKIFVSGANGYIAVWDVEQPAMPETTYRAYQGYYFGLQLIGDDTHLLLYKESTAEIRKLDQWFTLVFSITLPKNIKGVSYFEEQRLLAAADIHGNMQVWQFGEAGIGTGAYLVYQERVTDRYGKPVAMVFHPAYPILGRFARTGISMIDFSDAREPVTVSNVATNFSMPNILQFSPDGRYIVLDTAKTLLLWSAPWYWEIVRGGDGTSSNDLTGTVSAGQSINVRGAPDNYAVILGQLNPGDNLIIVGQNADGTWLQVLYRGTTAWVAKFLIAVAGDPSHIPVVPDASAPDTAAQTLAWSGTVRSLNDGATVSAVSLRVGYKDSALSGADGSFLVSSVPPGKWGITVSALYHQLPYPDMDLWFDPRNDALNQDVWLLENPRSIVRMTITSETGKAIENSQIRLYRLDTLDIVGEYRTDDDGFLPDIELPGGPYLVEALESSPRFGQVTAEVRSYDNRDFRKAAGARTSANVYAMARPEMVPQSPAGRFDLLIALKSQNCPKRFVTVFDLRTRRILASEASNTQRMVISFDATNTSGTYLIRYQTGCDEKINHTVFEADPDQGWQITFTE